VTDASSPAANARRLLRATDRATLATAQPQGWPYASLTLLALAQDGSPLLLLSDLAEHTKNLRHDPRVSLLIDGTAGRDDPLTGPRVTVLGEAAEAADPSLLARFTRRHPSAERYAGFADFRLYQVRVIRAHLVAGFGRIDWIEAPALLSPPAPALATAEADVIAHMNEDHAETLELYAERIAGQGAGTGWRMTGIDPEGFDLRRGGCIARLDFRAPVGDAEGARAELVHLAKLARGSL
jgi:heme oxygenase (biliverdin-IX-beta and delta-forming)